MKEKVTAKRKPKECLNCGCIKIASIQYGMPAFSPELRMDLDEGKIVLGGCCVSNDDPAWQCVECGMQIYREKQVPCEMKEGRPKEEKIIRRLKDRIPKLAIKIILIVAAIIEKAIMKSL